MGRPCVEHALGWLSTQPLIGGVPYRPKLVISAGFAGGLAQDLRVGDLVVATEICDEAGSVVPVSWPGELSGVWQPVPHRGRILTNAAPVALTEQKKALAEQYTALAVDMESVLVARWCLSRQIPFGAVRVISDDAHTSLSSELQGLLAGGQPSIWRIMAAVARSPKLLGELSRLTRHTHLAGKQLGRALGELLTLTLPFGAQL